MAKTCRMCADGAPARKLQPSGEPVAIDPETLAALSPEDQARFRAAHEKQTWVNALHEAGHVVAGAYYGRSALYAQAGADPHASFATTESGVGEEALVVPLIAGAVGVGVAAHWTVGPTRDEMAAFLGTARAGGKVRRCDDCMVATILTLTYPEETDDELAARWCAYGRRTIDLFDSREWRRQLLAVARALHEKVLLTGADLAELVDVEGES